MSAARVHWADLAELGGSFGLRFLYGIYRLFGRLPFRVVLYPVVCWYFLASPSARNASLEYLQRLHATHGVLPRTPDWRLSLKHFLSFAETILDKLIAMSGRANYADMDVHGRDLVAERLRLGRGVVLLTAHVGNLEMCRALGQFHDRVPRNVLVHTRHAETFNRMLARLSPENNIQLIQVTEVDPATIGRLNDCIERGEVVVIAADRVPVSAQPRVTIASFLGKPAPFPIGPYVLASLLKCPVYLLLCARRAQSCTIRIEPFRESISLPRATRDAAMAELAQDFADRLAAHCASAPYEWFNFYPFWNMPESDHHANAKPQQRDPS